MGSPPGSFPVIHCQRIGPRFLTPLNWRSVMVVVQITQKQFEPLNRWLMVEAITNPMRRYKPRFKRPLNRSLNHPGRLLQIQNRPLARRRFSGSTRVGVTRTQSTHATTDRLARQMRFGDLKPGASSQPSAAAA